MPNDGYKFVDTKGATTAVLDPNGKFTLKDGPSSIEVFANWRDFVKSMGEKPVMAAAYDEPVVLEQLSSLGLGKFHPIIRGGQENSTMAKKNGTTPSTPSKKAAATPAKTESKPKAAATPAKAPAKTAEKKPATPAKDLPMCACGCGEQVLNAKREFRQGHDARVHGWAKKVERGDMKLTELNPTAQAWMKAHGIKQGTPKK
jgi:hypothetical protein